LAVLIRYDCGQTIGNESGAVPSFCYILPVPLTGFVKGFDNGCGLVRISEEILNWLSDDSIFGWIIPNLEELLVGFGNDPVNIGDAVCSDRCFKNYVFKPQRLLGLFALGDVPSDKDTAGQFSLADLLSPAPLSPSEHNGHPCEAAASHI
jgi:hypothetical protein